MATMHNEVPYTRSRSRIDSNKYWCHPSITMNSTHSQSRTIRSRSRTSDTIQIHACVNASKYNHIHLIAHTTHTPLGRRILLRSRLASRAAPNDPARRTAVTTPPRPPLRGRFRDQASLRPPPVGGTRRGRITLQDSQGCGSGGAGFRRVCYGGYSGPNRPQRAAGRGALV